MTSMVESQVLVSAKCGRATKPDSSARTTSRVATRVLVVAMIGMALVPASVWVSQKVDETYRVSIEAAEQKATDAASAEDSDNSKASKKKAESTESKNVLEQLADGASGLVTSVTSGAKQMTDEIVQQVTDLIEGGLQ